jgi:hypothetical protein
MLVKIAIESGNYVRYDTVDIHGGKLPQPILRIYAETEDYLVSLNVCQLQLYHYSHLAPFTYL